MLASAEEALNYNRQSGMANENQTSLFGGMESAAPVFRLKDAPEASKEEKIGLGEKNCSGSMFPDILWINIAKDWKNATLMSGE